MLVNNASAIRFGAIDELSFADWSFTIRNELDIVFLVTRAAWPHLVASGGGSIVNVGSITASRGALFMPQNAHGAAKGGVLALTYQLVVEGGPHGIRVNAVSPAMTETPHTAPLLADPGGPAASIAARVPLGRWGQPEDVANAILFLSRRVVARERREHPGRRRRGGGRVTAPLPARLAGRLLLRGDPGYEQARTGRIFNARRPDRFPAAVLLAASTRPTWSPGVRLAAERGWPVSVRSGGHSWAAWSLRDDALLIDLGGLRDLAYDPATGVVSARPAIQGGLELAPFLAERGRAFPGRALRVGRPRRLPAAGRPGLERAGARAGPARASSGSTW